MSSFFSLVQVRFSIFISLSIFLPTISTHTLSQTLDNRHINPIIYQSSSTSLSQWIGILTLCFTPLIMHIVAGVPDSVVLSKSKPTLLSRLPHFNPTSILWRYYAIADRRCRAKKWDVYDMAASNAAVWNGKKWVSSEFLMVRCRNGLITKVPESRHVEIISVSFLKSVVITIQGAQGLLYVVHLAPGDALPTIFYGLAVIGLFRLQAMIWLSDDYAFSPDAGPILENNAFDINESPEARTIAVGLIRERLLRSSSWKGVLFRLWWLCSMLAIAIGSAYICANGLIPMDHPSRHLSVSSVSQRLFYTLHTVGGMFIHTVYVLGGRSNSTLIPCINSSWYQVYSFVVCLSALSCIIIASIETRVIFTRDSNAEYDGYTTYPPSQTDAV